MTESRYWVIRLDQQLNPLLNVFVRTRRARPIIFIGSDIGLLGPTLLSQRSKFPLGS